jgi:fatty acid desaturase
MIERLQRIATILARFRLPLFVLAGFSLVVLVLSVLDNPLLDNDRLLMPAILGLCWALMLYSTGELFQEIPHKAGSEATFRRRMGVRVRRGILWVLGLLTIVSAAGLLILSYQLMRVWL